MKSILSIIAWRNIWRNPRRSAVLIGAIALGVFSVLMVQAFIGGMIKEMTDSTTRYHGGQISINQVGYNDNPELKLYLTDAATLTETLSETPNIVVAPIISLAGMVSSPQLSMGIFIHGIDPEKEAKVTEIANSVTEGTYFSDDDRRREIVISSYHAKKLAVGIGNKVVIMANDVNNDLQSAAFRVVGIYETPTTAFDKMMVYVRRPAAAKLANFEDAVTGYSIGFTQGNINKDILDQTAASIAAAINRPDAEVLTWTEKYAVMLTMLELGKQKTAIIVIIFFIAIGFIIVNSFLMVIFERIHELGVMMANGIKPKQIRRMLFLEAGMQAVLGLVIGSILATLLIWYWAGVGLDLSNFADGLGEFGVGAIMYPLVEVQGVITDFVLIIIMVGLAVLYPANKASKFEIMDAINYI